MAATPGNKNQIIICWVYRKTTVIIRKIIILTVLGGHTIFIASLLLLIFLSCITQLEVREERWKTCEEKDTEERERQRLQGMEGERERERVRGGRLWTHVFGFERDRQRKRDIDEVSTTWGCVFLCVCVCLFSVCGRNRCTVPPNDDRWGRQATRRSQWPQAWEALEEGKQGEIRHRERNHKINWSRINQRTVDRNLLAVNFSFLPFCFRVWEVFEIKKQNMCGWERFYDRVDLKGVRK